MGVLEEQQVLDAGFRRDVTNRLDASLEAIGSLETALERHTGEDTLRFERGSRRFGEIERKLDENTTMCSTIQTTVDELRGGMAKLTGNVDGVNKKLDTLGANTAAIVAANQKFQGFKDVMRWLGDMLVRVSLVITAGTIVYLAVFRGEVPTVMKKTERAPTAQLG